jgi:hypothetical protein
MFMPVNSGGGLSGHFFNACYTDAERIQQRQSNLQLFFNQTLLIWQEIDGTHGVGITELSGEPEPETV